MEEEAGSNGDELATLTTRQLASMLLNETTLTTKTTTAVASFMNLSTSVPTLTDDAIGSLTLETQSTWNLLITALFYKQEGEEEANRFDINWFNFILALILIMLMLTTAIGNLFVIVAILIERNLRTIGNYLVLSLAIADLLVACLVMPLAGIYQILERWTLGVTLCDIWTSADVFCCTASILHLLAIALDRYWAVTRVDYIRCQRNERRILLMIFFVWFAACIISLAPVFGWKDAQFEWRITKEQECLISQDVGYQIFATCTTFYFPLTLTLIFYWKIYQVARKRIRRKPGNRVKISLQHPSSSSSNSSPAAQKQRHLKTVQQTYKPIAESLPNQGLKSSIQRQIYSSKGGIDQQSCQCSCHIQTTTEAAAAEAASGPITVKRANRSESGRCPDLEGGSYDSCVAHNITRNITEHKRFMDNNNNNNSDNKASESNCVSELPVKSISGTEADGLVVSKLSESAEEREALSVTNGCVGGDCWNGSQITELTLNNGHKTTTTAAAAAAAAKMRGNFSVDNQIFAYIQLQQQQQLDICFCEY